MSMRTTQGHHGVRRKHIRAIAGAALVALLTTGVLASCASTPRAVLNVPGSYTAVLGPTIDYPNGAPSAAVLMCVDEETAVRISGAGDGILGLTWAGEQYVDTGFLITPVLSPGCGLLTFTTPCCIVLPTLTVHAEKWSG